MADKDTEEETELVDLWNGVEFEEDHESPTDEELDEETEEDEDQEEEEDLDEEEELEDSEEDFVIDDEEEEEDEEDIDEEVPLVKEIQESIGFEFDEEFEDNEEGIQRLVEESSKKLADQELNRVFSEFPEVQELYEYRRMGGDPDKFLQTKFPEVDFNEVEFDNENEEQHEMLVKRELAMRGYEGDDLDAELEDIKNGGILESKAKRALSNLQAKQEEQQEQLLKEQKEKHEEKQKQIKEYWEDVNDYISESTEFKGLKVPSKDKDEFFDYLSKPVQNGMSQRDLDVQEADLETRLAIDYLIYKGFKLEDIIDRKAKSKNADTLRERMKKRKLERKKREQSSSSSSVELGTI